MAPGPLKKKKKTQTKPDSDCCRVQSSKLQSKCLFWVNKGFYQLPMESVTSISELTFFNPKTLGGLPDGSVVKSLPANTGNMGSTPSPGESRML